MLCGETEAYTPDIEIPYPDSPGLEISDFCYQTPLHLCRCVNAVQRRVGEDADYIVSQPYTVGYRYDGVLREIAVPEGMVTDLTSVPRFARIFIGRVGPHLEASIVHDFLYIAWQDLEGHGVRKDDRKFSDKLLLVAMSAADVSLFNRYLIYFAVRGFGWWAYAREDEFRYVRDKVSQPQDDSATP